MPITDEGRIEYQMPEEIKNQFTKPTPRKPPSL